MNFVLKLGKSLYGRDYYPNDSDYYIVCYKKGSAPTRVNTAFFSQYMIALDRDWGSWTFYSEVIK